MQQFLLKPYGPEDLKNKIFETPYGALKKQLIRKEVRLDTYDLGDMARADQVLLFNYDAGFYDQCRRAGLGKQQLVLFAFEPRVVIPEQYGKKIWDQFGKVFTHRDDLVDNQRIFKLRYPMGKPISDKVPGYKRRKFLTLINANKYSYVSNQLYSYRRRAIRYFENFPDFDLYGRGWGKGSSAVAPRQLPLKVLAGHPFAVARDLLDTKPYSSFRGSVDDKYKALEEYRFSLCFENEKNSPGYITEKLFDCLIAGTVPVYLGAPNIADYVPSECFIDMRDFRDFSELRQHLLQMPEAEFMKYQSAGQKFLRSGNFKSWQPESVFKQVAKDLV
jgi:hypothetical protein